jgi:exonuclease VII small subunit
MRKKAIDRVYGVVKTVSELEDELRASPNAAGHCSEDLELARQQLHDVLEQVHASEVRNSEAA